MNDAFVLRSTYRFTAAECIEWFTFGGAKCRSKRIILRKDKKE